MIAIYSNVFHSFFLLLALDQSDLLIFCALVRAGEFSTGDKKLYPYALTVKDLQSFLGKFGQGKGGGQVYQENAGKKMVIKKEPDVPSNKMQANKTMPFFTKYPPKYLGSYLAPQSHGTSGISKSRPELIDLTADVSLKCCSYSWMRRI